MTALSSLNRDLLPPTQELELVFSEDGLAWLETHVAWAEEVLTAPRSASDATLIEVCRIEDPVLISLDKGFADTLRYRPSLYRGIVVLRLREPLCPIQIEQTLHHVLALAAVREPAGRLWIVDDRRIREFVEDESP
jgi:hypothetical protein